MTRQDHDHFLDGDNRLVTVVGHEVDWWDPVTGERVAHLDLAQLGHAERDEKVFVASHPDTSRITLVVWGRPDVRVLDIRTGAQVEAIPVGEDVIAATFQNGSPYLAILRRGAAVELWDIEAQRRMLGPLRSLGSTSSPDAQVVTRFLDEPGEYLQADAGLIQVWRAGIGRTRAVPGAGRRPVRALLVVRRAGADLPGQGRLGWLVEAGPADLAEASVRGRRPPWLH